MSEQRTNNRLLLTLAAIVIFVLAIGAGWVLRQRAASRRATIMNAAHLSTATSRQTIMRFVLRNVLLAQRDYLDAHGAYATELAELEFDDVPGVTVTLLTVSGDTLVIQAEDLAKRDRCHVWVGGYDPSLELEDWGEGEPACLDSRR